MATREPELASPVNRELVSYKIFKPGPIQAVDTLLYSNTEPRVLGLTLLLKERKALKALLGLWYLTSPY